MAREIEQALADRIDEIDVRVAYLPARSRPEGQKYAEALLCAEDQGKGATLHKALLAGVEAPPVGMLVAVAEEAGLEGKAFGECISRGTRRAAVLETRDSARRLAVGEPPAAFVGPPSWAVRLDPGQIDLLGVLLDAGFASDSGP